MATSLDALERRVAALEEEMIRLRQPAGPCSIVETPAQRGARVLAEAIRDKAQSKAQVEQLFAQMGINLPPVPPEQLRAMMAAEGIKAEDNLFSRGIREMREE